MDDEHNSAETKAPARRPQAEGFPLHTTDLIDEVRRFLRRPRNALEAAQQQPTAYRPSK